GLGDVAALVADRADHAEHHVVDPLGVQRGVARGQRVDQTDHQRDRFGPVQGPLLAAPARGADRVVDERLGAHGRLLLGPAMLTRPSPSRLTGWSFLGGAAVRTIAGGPPFRLQPVMWTSTPC